MPIETTEFSSAFDDNYNMSSTTSAMIIDTTETSTVFSYDLNSTQAYDTPHKNTTIVLNNTLDVDLEFTIGDELIEKIFDFLSDKLIGQRIDKFLEITQFVAEMIGPSIAIYVKNNMRKMPKRFLHKKRKPKIDPEDFEYEVEDILPECPITNTCVADLDISEHHGNVCASLWYCRSDLLMCDYDRWYKQNKPTYWEPEMNQKDDICKLREKIDLCKKSVSSNMPISRH